MRRLVVLALLGACGKGSPTKMTRYVRLTTALDVARIEITLYDKSDNKVAADGTLAIAIARDERGKYSAFDTQPLVCRGSVAITKSQFADGELHVDVPLDHCPPYTDQYLLVATRFTPAGESKPIEDVSTSKEIHPMSPDDLRGEALSDACLVAHDRAKADALRREARPAVERDIATLAPELQRTLAAMIAGANPCERSFDVTASLIEFEHRAEWTAPVEGTTSTLEDTVHTVSWPDPIELADRYRNELVKIGHGWLRVDRLTGSPTSTGLNVKLVVSFDGRVLLGDKQIPRLRMRVMGAVSRDGKAETATLADLVFDPSVHQEVSYKSRTDKYGLTQNTAVSAAFNVMASVLREQLAHVTLAHR